MSPIEPTHSLSTGGPTRSRPLGALLALVLMLALSFSAVLTLPAAAQDTSTPEATSSGSFSVADVAAKANPAVVTIYTYTSAQQNNGLLPIAPGNIPQAPSAGNGEQPLGAGSGWIYDEDGHVITNNHVVQGADTFKVEFQDGTQVDAKLVGTDVFQDVAVLKLELSNGQKLPGVATVGDSSQMRAGDQVVALGTPLGQFANSVSEGIIGGLNRSLDTGSGYRLGHLIQHDAPLSSGNSGGPLVNMQGEVIGMNVAAISNAQTQMSGAQTSGLGFAIDGNTVVKSTKQIIENNGDIVYPYLGIQGQETQGGQQVVVTVESGSPAAKAGLQPGDVITALDGTKITSENPLINELFTHQPGDKVTLTIERNGSSQKLTVTLGERPANA
jgi:2-alkenal reductase